MHVTCPQCGRRFPFDQGLQVRRPSASRWQGWLGWLLLPVGYPAEGCRVPDLRRKALDEILTVLEASA